MFSFLDKIERPPLEEGQKSYQPIREAKYLGDIETHLALPEIKMDVDKAIELQRFFSSQYRELATRMQVNSTALTKRTETAMKNLELVTKFLLEGGKEYDTLVQVAPGVLRRVVVPPVVKVTLQVSTGLQMEFDLKEAREFIISELTNLAKQNLKLEHDIDFLQDQITTIELNITSLYNYEIEK
ncbi:hypothetical protein KR074_001357, partial [Drosophila pseudoananassae]